MIGLAIRLLAEGQQCQWWDIICTLSNAGQSLVKSVSNAALGPLADVFMNAWAQLEMLFLASWVAIPLLVDVNNPEGTVAWLQGVLGPMTFWFAVMGALVTAGWTFLRLGPEKVRELGWRLVVLLLVTTAGPLMVATLDAGARTASLYLLLQVGVGNPGVNMASAAAMQVSPGITFLVGLIACLGVMIQWAIMIARGPIVVVLLGVWPLTAAAATLGVRSATASVTQVTSWLVAFLIYPFPAAIVYAAAFKLKSGADGITGVMYGLVLELIAIFLLPAVLRIVAPQVQALGAAYGGTIAAKMAIAATETAMAVGAAVVTAGAVSGMIAGKGASAASSGASGGMSFGGSGSGGGGGGLSAPAVAAELAQPGPAERGSSGGGADSVSADTATPTADGAASSTDAVAAVGPSGASESAAASVSEPAGGSGGSAGSSSVAAERPRSAPASREGGVAAVAGEQRAAEVVREQRFRAAASAAQVASQSAARQAREGLDDIDEIVGGKHHG